MFKFLRSNAKFFYWIIAATFVGFIFLAWGMEMGRGGSTDGPAHTVGSVEGVEISAWQFERAVQEVQAGMQRQQPGRPLTVNQAAMARDQAWDQLVRNQLLVAEVQRRGLRVSDREIERIFRESPPPEVTSAFTDEQGRIDMQAYYNALGNPASGINWPQVEQWVRRTVPQQKLIQMLVGGMTVSEDQVREFYDQQTGQAVVEYMGLALEGLAPDFEPDQAVVSAYYTANPGEFRQPPQGKAQIADWEIAPSETDFDEVRELALEVKAEIDSGARSFEEAAAIYSEDGTADSGGDLGTFDRNRMVAPFTEAAFALPVGRISEPVQTQFGFHLIEVLDQEMEDDEVKRIHARHILLRVTPSESTRAAVIDRARAFRRQATAQGFVALAERDTSCQVLSPPPLPEGRDFPGLRQSAAGNRWLFRAKPQQISPLFFTEDHVYVVLAESITPAGPQPLERVRSQIVLELKREQQRLEASSRLAPAVHRVRQGEAMSDVAAELELLYAVTDTLSASSNIPDVGYATPLNIVALRAPVGQLVPEVATYQGVFALRTLWRKPFDAEDYAGRREQIRVFLLQRKQVAALDAWFAKRMEAARIQDRRDEYLAGL